ncbi:restriction endonuclease subunit S [Staphylococcus shinii]
MTNEMKSVPELRFLQFDKEWEKTTIADIGDFYYGRSAPKWSITDDATIPCVRYGELYTKHKGTVKEIYSYTNIDRNKLRFSKGGEILIPRVGEDPMDFAKCSYLPFSGIAIGEMISVYNTDQNPVFITAYFNSQMKYEFAKRVEGASVSNLYYSYLKDINLRIPTIEEQQKIGIFFSKLDRQIELEEQKLEKLEEQKKGYMQKIFSQELRFKDENGNDYPDWKSSKIENQLKERNERSGEGQMLSVTINSGIVKFNELDRKDNSSKDKSNYKVVKKGDIAYNSMRMWQGASGKSDYDGIVSPAYTVIYPTQSTSSAFIEYKFKTYRMIHTFKINSQGLTSDTWNLKYKQLKNINIDMPVLKEQEKIGSFFKKIDQLINKQKEKVEILQKNKNGFLQKMFV